MKAETLPFHLEVPKKRRVLVCSVLVGEKEGFIKLQLQVGVTTDKDCPL